MDEDLPVRHLVIKAVRSLQLFKSFHLFLVPQEPIPEILAKVKNIPTDHIEVVRRVTI